MHQDLASWSGKTSSSTCTKTNWRESTESSRRPLPPNPLPKWPKPKRKTPLSPTPRMLVSFFRGFLFMAPGKQLKHNGGAISSILTLPTYRPTDQRTDGRAFTRMHLKKVIDPFCFGFSPSAGPDRLAETDCWESTMLSGLISAEQLHHALVQNGQTNYSMSQVRRLVSLYDDDRDGYLDREGT